MALLSPLATLLAEPRSRTSKPASGPHANRHPLRRNRRMSIPRTGARQHFRRALHPLCVLAVGLAVFAAPAAAFAVTSPQVAAPAVTAAVASDNPIVRYAEDIA